MRAPFAAFDAAEHAARVTRARAAMRTAGLRALVCCAPENGFYLAGYDSWTAVNSPQMLVFTDAEDVPTLLLRNVDLPLARESSWLDDLRCVPVSMPLDRACRWPRSRRPRWRRCEPRAWRRLP